MKITELVLGKPKSPLDPKVFERLALAAFLAWVGLGADGLSSSCYGPEEIFKELAEHAVLAHKWGFYAEARSALGVDVVDEATALCTQAAKDFPRTVFFAGHLVFEQPGLITRMMHEQTAFAIQRRLQFAGLTVELLPIRVYHIERPAHQPQAR